MFRQTPQSLAGRDGSRRRELPEVHRPGQLGHAAGKIIDTPTVAFWHRLRAVAYSLRFVCLL
ncbi:hypothetical protein [uncultured Paraglaciecola sp.]|uniref:hypothetical protein n=1 Tax=uncultured Paraglaciecola sp. TaxID=1765024 RepID=UPI00261FB6D8|nr:hypothetical protein [uncultured Paraglaciecola sp.]